MTRALKTLAAAASLALSASLAAQTVPEIAFDTNADLLKLPETTHFGEVAGVATNSKGHIFVYTRTGASHATLGTSRTFYKAGSRLFQFDPAGKFVREIGVGAYGSTNPQPGGSNRQATIRASDPGPTPWLKFDPPAGIKLDI